MEDSIEFLKTNNLEEYINAIVDYNYNLLYILEDIGFALIKSKCKKKETILDILFIRVIKEKSEEVVKFLYNYAVEHKYSFIYIKPRELRQTFIDHGFESICGQGVDELFELEI